MVFQNIEGSIVAKASSEQTQSDGNQVDEQFENDPQKALNSYTAVLANICHEYIEFGHEAFDNNKFQHICIKHQGKLLIVRPIFKSFENSEMNKDEILNQQAVEDGLRSSQQLLLLCFICDIECNLGEINIQIKTLSDQIASQLQYFTMKLYTSEKMAIDNAPATNVGYDPMKDPNKKNVVY